MAADIWTETTGRRGNGTTVARPVPQVTQSTWIDATLTEQQRAEVVQVVREQISLTFGDRPAPAVPKVDDLYRDLTTSRLKTALELLDEALRFADAAAASLEDEDVIGADDELSKLAALLPELFCCRSLGEGFAAVVNALRQSLLNRLEKPLDPAQLAAIRRALTLVRTKPFISFEDAVRMVMMMEDAGLDVDHPAIEVVADDAESIS